MIEVVKFSAHDWKQYSENAHMIAFNEIKSRDFDRIDFALLVVNENRPLGYVTCRETNAESVYWQFGGSFPGTKDTAITFRGYQVFIDWTKARYKRISTLIRNDNTVMLKMAMKVGFRIVGIKTFQDSILLDHVLEFSE